MEAACSLVVYLYIPTSNHNALPPNQNDAQVVYLYIPTSNHNEITADTVACLLYIFIFLHQTTTRSCSLLLPMCCISLYSYIKPQPERLRGEGVARCISLYSYIKPQPDDASIFIVVVVYLYIPTSNHNLTYSKQLQMLVVYLYIPTSNHNE